MNAALGEVVSEVVSAYAKKCWWADVNDLRQEAWIAVMESRATWDPAKGSIKPYASVAARRAVGTFLVRASAPVSASWHERHALYGLQRAPAEEIEARLDRHPALPRGGAPSDRGWADEVLDDRRWRLRVLGRLLAVVGTEDEAGLDKIVGRLRRIGRLPNWLLESMERVKDKIRNDDELRALWAERGDDL